MCEYELCCLFSKRKEKKTTSNRCYRGNIKESRTREPKFMFGVEKRIFNVTV